MCEGFSQEDDLALAAAAMAEYDYLTIGIDEPDDPDCPNWTYTVGLLDRVGHPELIVAGPAVEPSYDLIHQIGHRILDDHRRFAPGDTWLSPFGLVLFGAVDPIQHRLNTFNRWNLMAEHGHLRVKDLEALQVFVPSTWFCDGHALTQPDLSDPAARVDVRHLPNRAARRARRR
jgi:hypothetical protein